MKLFAFVVITFGIASCTVEPSRVLPVRVGAHGQADLDACLAVGTTASELAVRLAPHRSASVSTSLRAGHEVHLCGTTEDGKWEAVVIPVEGQDCGVSRPVAAPQVYSGPCSSGWVESSGFSVVAG